MISSNNKPGKENRKKLFIGNLSTTHDKNFIRYVLLRGVDDYKIKDIYISDVIPYSNSQTKYSLVEFFSEEDAAFAKYVVAKNDESKTFTLRFHHNSARYDQMDDESEQNQNMFRYVKPKNVSQSFNGYSSSNGEVSQMNFTNGRSFSFNIFDEHKYKNLYQLRNALNLNGTNNNRNHHLPSSNKSDNESCKSSNADSIDFDLACKIKNISIDEPSPYDLDDKIYYEQTLPKMDNCRNPDCLVMTEGMCTDCNAYFCSPHCMIMGYNMHNSSDCVKIPKHSLSENFKGGKFARDPYSYRSQSDKSGNDSQPTNCVKISDRLNQFSNNHQNLNGINFDFLHRNGKTHSINDGYVDDLNKNHYEYPRIKLKNNQVYEVKLLSCYKMAGEFFAVFHFIDELSSLERFYNDLQTLDEKELSHNQSGQFLYVVNNKKYRVKIKKNKLLTALDFDIVFNDVPDSVLKSLKCVPEWFNKVPSFKKLGTIGNCSFEKLEKLTEKEEIVKFRYVECKNLNKYYYFKLVDEPVTNNNNCISDVQNTTVVDSNAIDQSIIIEDINKFHVKLEKNVPVKVLVTENVNVNTFYVLFDTLLNDLMNYYQAKIDMIPALTDVVIGKYCFSLFAGKHWFRAKIVSLKPLRVLHIDFGDEANVEKSNLKECPSVMKEIPPLIFKVKIVTNTPVSLNSHIEIIPQNMVNDTWVVKVNDEEEEIRGQVIGLASFTDDKCWIVPDEDIDILNKIYQIPETKVVTNPIVGLICLDSFVNYDGSLNKLRVQVVSVKPLLVKYLDVNDDSEKEPINILRKLPIEFRKIPSLKRKITIKGGEVDIEYFKLYTFVKRYGENSFTIH